jgi:hypothetical protein
VVEEVCTLDKLLHSIKSTFLEIIPKIVSPNSFDDFCSIALCSYLYNIIAKIIAVYLKLVLSNIMSPK